MMEAEICAFDKGGVPSLRLPSSYVLSTLSQLSELPVESSDGEAEARGTTLLKAVIQVIMLES